MITEDMVLDALRDVYDPEIPVNVVDLGLVYEMNIEEEEVYLTLTMTSPGCPFGDRLASDARDRVIAGSGAREVHVTMVTNPPWTPALMSEDAKKALGFF